MSTTKLERELAKIDKAHEKTVAELGRELAAVLEQAESARVAIDEARGELATLEDKRGNLATEVFAGDATTEDLDSLDVEIRKLQKRLEVAQIVYERAGKALPGIEDRLDDARREAAGRRRDVLAAARKERAVALDDALDSVTSHIDGLLELDRRQSEEEHRLGIQPLAVPYRQTLEQHLACRLQRYSRSLAMSITALNFDQQNASLAEKDFRTRPLEEIRAENEAEVALAQRDTDQRRAHNEARQRNERFQLRRQELRGRYGYTEDNITPMGTQRRTKVDQLVDEELSREFPDLFQQEVQARREKRRAELTSLLGYDRAELSEDEAAQLKERVDQQLAEEFGAAIAG